MHGCKPSRGQGATQPSASAYRPLLGQGATEYLVILSVVLIIGLVSVSLLNYAPSVSSDVSHSASKAYWQSNARPIAIQDAGLTADSQFSFVVQNNNPDPVSLTSIQLDSQDATFAEAPEEPSGDSVVYLAPGEKKAINVALESGFNCKEGAYGRPSLRMVYSTPFTSDLVQESATKFVLKCSMNSGSFASGGLDNPETTYWTQWYNRDDAGGSGDWEIREFEDPPPCGDYATMPVGVECRTLGDHVPADQTGQTLSWYSAADGCVCENWRNDWSCLDYEVRFLCPQ